jgi:hypothetical protein
MATKYTCIYQSKSTQKIAPIGIFGLKINHLATMVPRVEYFAS